MDAHKNFAGGTVQVAPSPNPLSGTSLTLTTGDAAKFPDAPFWATVWPPGVQPSAANAEVVRVTAVVGEVLTITRAQQSSTARAIASGWQIAQTVTGDELEEIASGPLMGRFLYVDQVNGSNLTGTRGKANKPFVTITAAKAAASPGDIVVVGPGNYVENNLCQDELNYEFKAGVTISYTDPGTGPGYGIFDDRATGAVTMMITGALKIVHLSSNPSNPNLLGSIVLQDAATVFDFTAAKISLSSPQTSAMAGIYVKNCLLSKFNVPEVTDTGDTWSDLDPEDPTFQLSGATGVYWEAGEMICRISRVTMQGSYALYCKEPAGGATTNLDYTGDVLQSEVGVAFYADTNSANYRIWVDCKRIICVSGTNSGMNLLGPAKIYIDAQKIASPQTAVNAECELWLRVEKITAGTNCVKTTGVGAVNARLEITCQHFEDTGGSSNAMIENNGGTLIIHGGHAISGAAATGPIVKHNSGTSRIVGLIADATANSTATNRPVVAAGSGLKLQGCWIVAAALADASVYAAAAQTVQNAGTITNKAKHANVTIAGEALTVDAAIS